MLLGPDNGSFSVAKTAAFWTWSHCCFDIQALHLKADTCNIAIIGNQCHAKLELESLTDHSSGYTHTLMNQMEIMLIF